MHPAAQAAAQIAKQFGEAARNSHEQLELLSSVELIDDETLDMIQDIALTSDDDALLFIVDQELAWRAKS